MSASDLAAFPIIETKLHRPPVPTDLVPRQRLTDWLNQRLQRPLTLVSAPAGYGKSTLISRWLESLDCPTAWVSLDEHDNDPAVFLAYFIAAIRRLFPQALTKTQVFLKSPELPETRYLASSLINELNAIQGEYVLVLDDYHQIHTQEIHDFVNEVLLHPPPGFHLVIGTRTEPPLSLMNLRVRSQMTEIRTQDLRFKVDEIPYLMERLLDHPIGADTATSLEEQTEGWVTGLRLTALVLRHRVGKDQVTGALNTQNRYVAEYLLTETLDQLEPEIQRFLLKTSILDRLCGPLCDAITGLDEPVCDGQAFLEWLHQQNLFTTPLDEVNHWYRYHLIFQEFLQRQLMQQTTDDEIANLHALASNWYAENGYFEEAFFHALKACDDERAAQLLTQQRHILIDREQWNHLEKLLNLFDRSFIETHPELLILSAWLHNVNGRWQEELAALARVESQLASTAIPREIVQPIRGEIHLMRANLTGWTYNGPEVLKHTEVALELLPRQWRYAYTSAYMIDSYGHLLCGDIDLARKQLQIGLADPQITSQPQNKTMLMFGMAGLFWASLNLSEMGQFSRQYLAHAKEFNLQEAIAVANYFLGCFHYLQNDLPSAKKHFSAAVETRFIITLNWQTQAACGLALTYYAMGEIKQAADVLEAFQAKLIERDNFMLLNVIKACQAEVALFEGKVAEATHWAESYQPQPIIGLQGFYIPQLTLIKVWMAQDTVASHEKAADLMDQMMEIAKGAHLRSAQFPILLMGALLEQKLGDEAAAFNKLEEAIHLAEPNGILRPFVDLGPRMAVKLEGLREQGYSKKYINRILKTFPKTSVEIQSSKEDQIVEPLTERELEILTLLAMQLSNKEIAERLVISKGTVKQHTHKIYQKLGVNGRWQAVTEATRLGILPTVVEE
jgi:LuxR family maltose regulon positive regulatory protein